MTSLGVQLSSYRVDLGLSIANISWQWLFNKLGFLQEGLRDVGTGVERKGPAIEYLGLRTLLDWSW